jgi:hypothetical protein
MEVILQRDMMNLMNLKLAITSQSFKSANEDLSMKILEEHQY